MDNVCAEEERKAGFEKKSEKNRSHIKIIKDLLFE